MAPAASRSNLRNVAALNSADTAGPSRAAASLATCSSGEATAAFLCVLKSLCCKHKCRSLHCLRRHMRQVNSPLLALLHLLMLCATPTPSRMRM
jgi:hypothetical protein